MRLVRIWLLVLATISFLSRWYIVAMDPDWFEFRGYIEVSQPVTTALRLAVSNGVLSNARFPWLFHQRGQHVRDMCAVQPTSYSWMVLYNMLWLWMMYRTNEYQVKLGLHCEWHLARKLIVVPPNCVFSCRHLSVVAIVTAWGDNGRDRRFMPYSSRPKI